MIKTVFISGSNRGIGQAALIATGSMAYYSLGAAEILEENGIQCAVINMHTIKPIDTEALDYLLDAVRARLIGLKSSRNLRPDFTYSEATDYSIRCVTKF